jgi:hypothetical protein
MRIPNPAMKPPQVWKTIESQSAIRGDTASAARPVKRVSSGSIGGRMARK